MLKHKQKILGLVLVFTVLFIGISTTIEALSLNNDKISIKSEEDIDTWMPDKNLQEEIRKALKLNDVSEITKQSLSSLQQVKINFKKIQNIKGLEYAINIKSFNASYNQISDLSPIANLTSLKTVYLNMNEISDVSPLAGLKHIETLRLANNRISDLSPISGLTALKIVYLGGDRITDLSPLSNLTSLTELYLDNNQISDLSPLSNLTSLILFTVADQDITKDTKTIYDSEYQQQLDVKVIDGRFVDLTPDSSDGVYKGDGIIEWTGLSLGDHDLNSSWETMIKINNQDTRFNGTIEQKITVAEGIDAWMPDKNLQEAIRVALKLNDVSEITKESLSSLQQININSKKIQNLKGLEYATNLKDLKAIDNQISDLSPLSGLKRIEALRLTNNQISDLSPIAGLTKLKTVYLGGNRITDLRPLSGLTSLTIIDLSFNQISDLNPIAGLISLKYAFLGNNQLSDVRPLSGLRSLIALNLSNNQINDLRPLSGLTLLIDLNLNSNQISDVSPLSNLTSLIFLDIIGQNITKETKTIYESKYLQQLSVKAVDGRFVDLTPASSDGIYKGDGIIEWSGLSLGDHDLNSSWESIIKVNNRDTRFNGTIKQKVTVEESIDTWMPDKNLQEAIRVALKLNDVSEITKQKLSSLSELTADAKNIQNLKGLEYAINLKSFNASSNQISDLSPIADLTSLTNLDFSSNQISDLHPLSSLISLTELSLDNNQIGDLSPLSSLTSLISLSIDDQNITKDTKTIYESEYRQQLSVKAVDGSFVDLMPASSNGTYKGDGIIEWTGLSLGDNDLNSSWESIIKVNNHDTKFNGTIKQKVTVAAEAIDAWMPDKNLQEAMRVILKLNDVSKITKQSLSTLQEIKINTKEIQNLKGLEYAINIKFFDASSNQITDLKPLSNLRSLTTVYLSHNQISDLSPLSGLTSLNLLYLSGNQISDLSPLSNLTLLEHVYLGNNQISNLGPLSKLTSLRWLELDKNKVSNLNPLSGLRSLTYLYLIGNQISDISPLSNLTSLSVLEATDQVVTKRDETIYGKTYRQQLDVRSFDGSFITLSPVSSNGRYRGYGVIEWTRLTVGYHNLNSVWEMTIKDNNRNLKFSGINLQRVNVEGLANKVK